MAYENYFRTSIFGGYKKKDVIRYVEELEGTCEKLDVIRQKAEELASTVSTLLENGSIDAEKVVPEQQTEEQPEAEVQQEEPKPAEEPEASKAQETEPEPVLQQEEQPEVKKAEPLTSARPQWLPEGFTEDDFLRLKEKAAKYDAGRNRGYGAVSIFTESELKDRARDIENRAWEKAELILSETEKIAVKNREKADEALNSELKETAEKFASELKLIQDRINSLTGTFPERLAQRMGSINAAEESAAGEEQKNS